MDEWMRLIHKIGIINLEFLENSTAIYDLNNKDGSINTKVILSIKCLWIKEESEICTNHLWLCYHLFLFNIGDVKGKESQYLEASIMTKEVLKRHLLVSHYLFQYMLCTRHCLI